MRIAFLTPEFPSEFADGGGLGTYVARMAHSLNRSGHEAEVFVTTTNKSATIVHDDIVVHRVGPDWWPDALRAGLRIARHTIPLFSWRESLLLLSNSFSLAKAFEHRHKIAPFDLIQSADYFATGLFVRSRSNRVHSVRCSSAADLYSRADHNDSRFEIIRGYLERLAMRRADVAYAPSLYLAEYFKRVHSIDVCVVRPPAHVVVSQPSPVSFALPPRFFVHFGMLIERKGSDVLAQALPLAWKMVPELTMVWSGLCFDNSKIQKWRSAWGEQGSRVLITGPLPRPEIYSVLQKADAAVLPSLVDNLPNTVIESLSFGTPVIGTRGASIDELVEEGVTGHLVERGDSSALAQALVRMWRGETPVQKGFKWNSSIANEMKPGIAVTRLVELCERRKSSY